MKLKYVLLLLFASSKTISAMSAYEIAQNLYDSINPKPIILVTFPNEVSSADFNADDTRIVITEGGIARIYDVKTGTLLTTLSNSSPKLFPIYAARYGFEGISPEGEPIPVIETREGMFNPEGGFKGFRAWSIKTRKPLFNLRPDNYYFSSSFVSRGELGNYFAAGQDMSKSIEVSNDGTIEIKDARTNKKIVTFRGGPKRFFDIRLNTDGSKILIATPFEVMEFDLNRTFQILLLQEYFSDKKLPINQQALLVGLDALSEQKNGKPITKKDLLHINKEDLFKGVPEDIKGALKTVYNIADDVFAQPKKKPTGESGNIKQKGLYQKVSPIQLAKIIQEEKMLQGAGKK